MKFKLSVSPAVCPTKEDYSNISKGFVVREFDTEDTETLERLFRSQMVSNRYWKDGKVKGSNYIGQYGYMLDFDNGTPFIEEWQREWACYTYILYTSTNHRIDVPEHGGIQDRFRIIFPSSSLMEYSKEDMEVVGITLNTLFPTSDKSTNNGMARKYYPSCENNPNYRVVINNPPNSKYFRVDLFKAREEIEYQRGVELAKKKAKKAVEKAIVDKPGKVNKNSAFSREYEVKNADGNMVKVKDIKLGVGKDGKSETYSIYCPFCKDELESKSRSAYVGRNKIGRYFIRCVGSGCKQKDGKQPYYWEEFDVKQAIMDSYGCWYDAKAGKPATLDFDYTSDENVSVSVKYFITKEDWENYAKDNDIPKEFDVTDLPRMRPTFNPGLPGGYIWDKKLYNIFQEPEIDCVKDVNEEDKMGKETITRLVEERCPTISFVANNIIEKELVEYWYNWIAYQLQIRKKIDTAWIISTKDMGTGKDLFVKRVLTPLFGGNKQVNIVRGGLVDSKFNGGDANLWLKAYDEICPQGGYKENITRYNKIRDLITNTDIWVEPKGIEGRQYPSYIGYIFMSNEPFPLIIAPQDRRYYYSRKEAGEAKLIVECDWWKGKDDIEGKIANELMEFGNLMYALKVEEKHTLRPVDSERRNKAINSGRSTAELFFNAMEKRDLDYFDVDTNFTWKNLDLGINDDMKVAQERDEFKFYMKEYGYITPNHYKILGREILRTRSTNEMNRKLEKHGVGKVQLKLVGRVMKFYAPLPKGNQR